MSEKGRRTEAKDWQNEYYLAIILLVALGFALIFIGTTYPQGSVQSVMLIGVGMAMAPTAILSALFRFFLFRDVRYHLVDPLVKEVSLKVGDQVDSQVLPVLQDYSEHIDVLKSLTEAGIVRSYACRSDALRDFENAIDNETNEIMIMGCSLKGVLWDDRFKHISDKIRLSAQKGVTVKFLLLHPKMADLRAGQEERQLKGIGKDIIKTLTLLRDWDVPTKNVRLYQRAPTCFGIKTQSKMLLNPYPYKATSFDSPCFIVEKSPSHRSYIYEAYQKTHFSAWDSDFTVTIENYDDLIIKLENNLDKYADMWQKCFQLNVGEKRRKEKLDEKPTKTNIERTEPM